MDILLNVDTSLYWQIPLGLFLLVLAIFFIWLAFRIGKTLKSVKHAEYYRDKLAGSVTDIISAWSAFKAGWNALRGFRQSSPSGSEDIT